MIESLRKWGGSWSAKILLGILAASMGIFWGMGDLFMGRHPLDVVATVGDSEILTRDLRRELELRLAMLERKIGKRLTPEQITSSRLHMAILMDMVQQTLLDEEASRLNLVIIDAAVKEAVMRNPQFQNEAKVFSRERFQQFLKANSLFEKKFLDALKKDMRRNQLLKAFSGTLLMPRLMGDLLLKAQFQERYGAILTIKADQMKVVKPSNETLKAFYTQEKERFRAPETRNFTFALLDPQGIAATIQVTPLEIQKAFDSRIQEFKGQTLDDVRESLRQELAIRRAKTRLYELAQQIEDDLASGLPLEKVAPKYNLVLKQVPSVARNLSPQDKKAWALLPEDPALAQDILNEAFEATAGGEPVLKRLHSGMHYILRVEKIFASEIPPFEAIVEKVQTVWMKEKQEEQALQTAQNRARDILSGRISSKSLQKLPSVSLRRGASEDIDVPPQVKTILFEMAPGDVRVVQNLSGEAFAVQLLAIEDADPATIQDQIPAFLDQLRQMYEEDLLQAYIQSLRPRYHVKINREAVNRVL